MDVRHLTLLRELAERGSVVAVAAAGHRTPSAVSQQLRTAARELGVPLVEPAGRGLRLTEAGRLLADSAIEVETAMARALARVEDLRGRPQGRVRIAAVPSAAEYLVPPALRALAGEPIEVLLDDEDVAERTFVELARDADIVLGHSLTGPVPAGGEGLARRVVCREPLDVALPSGHRLATATQVRPEDLVGEPWIGVPVGFPFDSVLQAIEHVTGTTALVRQRVRDNRIVEALVAAGQGIAVLPRFTTRQRPDLMLRPLAGVRARRWVVAMSRRDRAERAAVRRVVAELVRAGRDVVAAGPTPPAS